MTEFLLNVGQWFIDTGLWWISGIMGICVYWLPVVILLVHYSMRSWSDIQEDRKAVEKYNEAVKAWENAPDHDGHGKPNYYHEHTTIGRMVGRYVVAFVPVVNLGLALFDALGEMMDTIGKRIRKIFNINIIAKPKV